MTTAHLDEEALSAALDGEATAAEAAHLTGCPRCRAELQSLAVVARAVGTPVAAAPASVVDVAITVALDAIPPVAEPWASGPSAGEPSAPGWSVAEPLAPRPLAPRPLAPRPTASRPPSEPATVSAGTGPRSRRALGWLPATAGIAAAVVVVAGFAALLGRVGHSTTASTSAGLASPSTAAAPFAAPVPSGNSTASSAAGRAATGDLGDQSDPVAVAQLVVPALSAPDSGTTAAASRAQTLGPAARPPCLAQALANIGSARAATAGLRYAATLRWRGQRAVVIVLSDPAGLTGLIMRTGDCSVLSAIPL